jgi:hypothetical protein
MEMHGDIQIAIEKKIKKTSEWLTLDSEGEYLFIEETSFI